MNDLKSVVLEALEEVNDPKEQIVGTITSEEISNELKNLSASLSVKNDENMRESLDFLSRNTDRLSPKKPKKKAEAKIKCSDDKAEVKLSEIDFLIQMQNKAVVLFEGLKNPSNEALDLKLELILNYLQYQISLIDARLLNIENKD